MTDIPRKPKREPWWSATFKDADILALRALDAGIANTDQQKRALKWILASASARNEQSFYPGDPHITSFLEGRRSVGNQIVRLIYEVDLEDKKVTNAP